MAAFPYSISRNQILPDSNIPPTAEYPAAVLQLQAKRSDPATKYDVSLHAIEGELAIHRSGFLVWERNVIKGVASMFVRPTLNGCQDCLLVD